MHVSKNRMRIANMERMKFLNKVCEQILRLAGNEHQQYVSTPQWGAARTSLGSMWGDDERKDAAPNLLLMTGLCARQRFCTSFRGKGKMFANIREEQGNIIIHDLNIKVCAFSVLAEWIVPLLPTPIRILQTHNHHLRVNRWGKNCGRVEQLELRDL